MGKPVKKLNAKSLVEEIVTVAGVSRANAENIFNLFSTAWQANRVSLLTVLEAGIVTSKKTARKSAPKAVAKKAATKAAPAAKTAPVKTAKKAAPAATAKKAVKLKKKTTASSTTETTNA